MLLLLPYITKVVIVSAIMYGYYWIALRNKKFHHFNRFYLLSVILLPLVVPFINIESLYSFQDKVVPDVFNRGVVMDNIVIDTTAGSFWNTGHVLNVLYLLVAGLLFIWFLISLIRVMWISRKCEGVRTHGIVLIKTSVKGTPFSFFKRIFWNPEMDLISPEGFKILNHELIHCRQWHSMDKIVVRFICNFFWVNPVFWMVKNEIYLVHEFLADKISFQSDSATFSRVILQDIYPGYSWSLTSSFFYSPIKRRIMMLLKNNHRKVNYMGRLMVLPLAVGLLIFFAMKANGKADTPNLKITQVDTTPNPNIQSVKLEQVIVVTNKDGSKKTMTLEEAKKAGIMVPPPPPPPPGVPAPAPPPKGIVPPQPGTAAPAPPQDGIVSPPPAPPVPLTLGALPDSVLILVDGNEVDQLATISPDQIQSVNVLKGPGAMRKYGVKGRYGVIEIKTKNSSTIQPGSTSLELNAPQSDTIPPGLDKIFTKTEVEAQFPGGQAAWAKYISRVIEEHVKELTKNDYGTCVVKFIIDTKGNVHDVQATTMKATRLAEISINAIRKGPKWIPAQQNGRNVNAYRLQPVTVKRP